MPRKPSPLKGKSLSEKTKARMRAAQQKRALQNGKPKKKHKAAPQGFALVAAEWVRSIVRDELRRIVAGG